MIWPWAEIARLKDSLRFETERNTQLLWRCEMRETIALRAMRDLAAANKGIRRLKERIKRMEKRP